MTKRQIFTAVIIAFLLTLGTQGARAATIEDTQTLFLDTGNTALSGYTGPFAQVTINLLEGRTDANIVFTSLTNGGYLYLLGGNGAVNLNVNGGYTLNVTTPTETDPDQTPQNVPGNADGFGYFSLSLNFFDGFQHAANKAEFTLTKASGIWVSASDVLTPNDNDAVAAAHVWACVAEACTSAATTGFAAVGDGGPPQELPEPGTLLLLGSAMLGLGALIRKRRSA